MVMVMVMVVMAVVVMVINRGMCYGTVVTLVLVDGDSDDGGDDSDNGDGNGWNDWTWCFDAMLMVKIMTKPYLCWLQVHQPQDVRNRPDLAWQTRQDHHPTQLPP